jgi:hypothetical protein
VLEVDVPPKGEIRLDDNVTIRPVRPEELWKLGEQSEGSWSHVRAWHLMPMLSENLMVVDISLRRDDRCGEQGSEVKALSDAVFMGLRLLSSGFFRAAPLGEWVNYGVGALGRTFHGDGIPERIGMGEGQYVLESTQGDRLRGVWPKLRGMVESEQDYLRLPAQKLLEGARRNRNDDAIIDYAIGLEALLISGLRQELSYRFALRGATIQAWTSEPKRKYFDALKHFYRTRSEIVHGERVAKEQLAEARTNGEAALRAIWWWFYENAPASQKKGTDLVEQRIVGAVS